MLEQDKLRYGDARLFRKWLVVLRSGMWAEKYYSDGVSIYFGLQIKILQRSGICTDITFNSTDVNIA